MAVHVAPGRPGILEFRPPFHRTDLGLRRRPPFGFRRGHQAIEPARRDLDITVEQHNPVGRYIGQELVQSAVVPSGKSMVLIQRHEMDAGKLPTQER